MIFIDLIVGARPNFVKIAPIIHEINKANEISKKIEFRLIHTGQHYDAKMSASFFKDLDIPFPDHNLNIGSGTQAEQTAGIMIGYEKLLQNSSRPSICLVVGDVTSTMACTIVARKNCIPVGHIEAGIRSNDLSMPEEINRLLTDSISNYFFTTSHTANENLKTSGVNENNIYFVGNTMIDTLKKNISKFTKPDFFDKYNLSVSEYFVLTLHRPSNVDHEENLYILLNEIVKNSSHLPIIFPVHPRTAKKLQAGGIKFQNLHLVEPLGYLDFNYLVSKSKAVITDSGGITEETTVLGIPCMTLRNTTERPETVNVGTNELLGTDPNSIKPAMEKLFRGEWKTGGIPELWDGKSAERIISHLLTIL